MWRDLTFCQCFLSSDTRKFMAKYTFCTSESGVIFTWPIATDRHNTFFIWNLIVALISLHLSTSFSEWVHMVGNLPALFRPGPNRRGICLIRASEAMKASYFLANFLTSFLSLLSFFKSSALMEGMPLDLASSQCCWSPSTHTLNLGLGTCFSLTVPEKRLSFWGS